MYHPGQPSKQEEPRTHSVMVWDRTACLGAWEPCRLGFQGSTVWCYDGMSMNLGDLYKRSPEDSRT